MRPATKVQLCRLKSTAHNSCIIRIQLDNCSVVPSQRDCQFLHCTSVHARRGAIFWQYFMELNPRKSIESTIPIASSNILPKTLNRNNWNNETLKSQISNYCFNSSRLSLVFPTARNKQENATNTYPPIKKNHIGIIGSKVLGLPEAC